MSYDFDYDYDRDIPSRAELEAEAFEDEFYDWCRENDLEPTDDARAEYSDAVEYMKDPLGFHGMSARDFLG